MKVTAVVSRLVRHALLAAPLMLVPAVGSVVMQGLQLEGFQSGLVFAQESTEKKAKYKTRKVPALRESVYKKLGVVQELTTPEDDKVKPNFKQALIELDKIKNSSKFAKFNLYEQANVYNYYGFIYYSLERFPEAIKYYKLVVAQSPNIPAGLEIGTLYTIAQLYMVLEDYRNGIKTLKQWMAASPIVGADAYVLLAQGYYQLDDMKQALSNVNIAVKNYDDKGKIPKENWLSLQRALYYEKGDNKTVIKILERMVRHYPKITYYKQLSGLYGSVGREKDQMFMLDAIYKMGALTKEKELLNLAYLHLGEDYPVRAAKIIDKGMKAKVIKETSKNLELLATSWRMAQEMKKSIPEMARAAKKSDKGNLYALLAGIYLDSDQYKKALDAGAIALKRKGIKRADQLYIVLGMANSNLGKHADAIKAFRKAAKDKRSKKFAVQWIQFAEGEIKREKQLNL